MTALSKSFALQKINTGYLAFSKTMHPSGRTLIFSTSNFHAGVFMCVVGSGDERKGMEGLLCF